MTKKSINTHKISTSGQPMTNLERPLFCLRMPNRCRDNFGGWRSEKGKRSYRGSLPLRKEKKTKGAMTLQEDNYKISTTSDQISSFFSSTPTQQNWVSKEIKGTFRRCLWRFHIRIKVQTMVDNNHSLLYYVHTYRSVKLIVDFF